MSTLVVVLAAMTAAPIVSDLLDPWIRIPSVVLEIGAGIVVGPILHWAAEDEVIAFLGALGLANLMFLAGTEIEVGRIRGGPLRRAGMGWALSLVLGVAFGFGLSPLDGPRAGLIVGLAVTTTALGTLLPILRDSGELRTPFGIEVLAGAAVGELGPLVAVALLLSSDRPARTALVLVAFAGVALTAAALANRPRGARLARLLEATITSSAQLSIRVMMLLVVLMVWIARELSLDVLLGAFAAGMVFRLFAAGAGEREAELVEAKIQGIGFGFLVPIFFVLSGMRFDVDALVERPIALLAVPGFLLAFLVIRGGPAFALARTMVRHDRLALSCFVSTQLPLVVVITTIGLQTRRIGSGTAAALVGAAMLSVLVLPLVAARLRGVSSSVASGSVRTVPEAGP